MWAAFEAERPSLIAYPGPFDGFQEIDVAVSKSSLVRFDHDSYSVAAKAALPPGSAEIRRRLADRADGGRQQHDRRPPGVLLRRVAILAQCRQTAPIGGRHGNGDSCTHAPDSHANKPAGIPVGIQMSDFIH